MHFDEIGQKICKTRKSKKITQENLANQLGMSRSTISSIEKGTISEIGVRKIMSICTALGLEMVVQEKTKRPSLQQLIKEQENA